MSRTESGEPLKVALESRLPAEVDRVFVRTGLDSTGGQAVWVLLILKDENPSRESIERLEGWASDKAEEHVPGYWPYVSFRTKNEQAELEKEPGSTK